MAFSTWLQGRWPERVWAVWLFLCSQGNPKLALPLDISESRTEQNGIIQAVILQYGSRNNAILFSSVLTDAE